MRHNKKFNHLSRKKGHRDALLTNLTISLIEHKRIFTTLAKAKALRVFAEPLITRSKKDDMANRRLVFSYLQNKEAVKELFGTIAEQVAARPGGDTRILKNGHRLGDNAEMAMIELVDFNENMLAADDKKAGKSRRTRRGGKKKAEATEVAPAAEAPAAEEKEAEESLPPPNRRGPDVHPTPGPPFKKSFWRFLPDSSKNILKIVDA